MGIMKLFRVALGFCLLLWGTNAIAQASYTVGGDVTGIDAIAISGIQLRLSTSATPSEDITVSGDGTFNFSTLVPDGSTYTVNFLPLAGVSGLVTNGSGTISGANVTNVLITVSASSPGSGTEPVPAPVMPLWLLGVMAAALAFIGSKRMKRNR